MLTKEEVSTDGELSRRQSFELQVCNKEFTKNLIYNELRLRLNRRRWWQLRLLTRTQYTFRLGKVEFWLRWGYAELDLDELALLWDITELWLRGRRWGLESSEPRNSPGSAGISRNSLCKHQERNTQRKIQGPFCAVLHTVQYFAFNRFLDEFWCTVCFRTCSFAPLEKYITRVCIFVGHWLQ